MIKSVLIALFAVVLSLSGHSAKAGIPVIDAAALAQHIQQVTAWARQQQQMLDQIQRLQQQLAQLQAMTQKLDGVRNLGSILNNPAVMAALPPDMRDTAQMVLNPANLSTSQASISQILTSFGVPATGATAFGNGNADALSRAQSIMKSTQMRQNQIQQLSVRVDSSRDAKESLDLLNRNTIEVATINNQLMQSIAALEAARQSNELRELAEHGRVHEAMRAAAATPLR